MLSKKPQTAATKKQIAESKNALITKIEEEKAASAEAPFPFESLELKLDQFQCVDETGLEGIFGEIYTADAINMGGTLIDGIVIGTMLPSLK